MQVAVARLAGPFSIKGEVRLVSLTATPSDVFLYGALRDSQGALYTVLRHRSLKEDEFAVQLQGITTRTHAEALPKTVLYVPREQLPTTDDDDFYHADLIGLAAYSTNGTLLGSVKTLCNFGGGDLLAIQTTAGLEILIPFTKTDVPVVDITAQRVEILHSTFELLRGDGV